MGKVNNALRMLAILRSRKRLQEKNYQKNLKLILDK